MISSRTTTPTSQSIIIYIDFPTIFPTNLICLIQCAPVIALDGSTTMTIIPPGTFCAPPPIIPPAIYVIYGIDLLLITALIYTPTPMVVPTPASQFFVQTQGIHDIYQQYFIWSTPTYCPAYFAFSHATSSTSIAPGLIFAHST